MNNNKKKKPKSTNWGSKWICSSFFFFLIYIYTFFFFFDKWNIWFLRVFFSKLRFAFVRFDAKERSKCLPGMLVYLNLDNCALEIGVEMDIKPERDLLYFWGGISEGFGWDILMCGAAYGTVHGNWCSPCCSEQSSERRVGAFGFSQPCFPLGDATEFRVSGVGRVTILFLIHIKHNRFVSKKKKNS